MEAVLVSTGHHIEEKSHANTPLTLAIANQYQGIFLANDAVPNDLLINYVNNGGCVYVGAGSGGTDHDSDLWNDFLSAFDINLDSANNHIEGLQSIDSHHPVFLDVNTLYQNNGNLISLKNAQSSIAQLISNTHYTGLYAIADLGRYAMPGGPNLELFGSLQNVGIETNSAGSIKLQVFNGSSFSASNVKGHLTFHGPCPLGESPETLYGAPISDLLSITLEDDTGILDNTLTFEKQGSSNTKVIPANAWSDDITVKIHASHNATDIGSQNLDNADYLLKMALESEIEVNVEEEQIVHFRVYPQ